MGRLLGWLLPVLPGVCWRVLAGCWWGGGGGSVCWLRGLSGASGACWVVPGGLAVVRGTRPVCCGVCCAVCVAAVVCGVSAGCLWLSAGACVCACAGGGGGLVGVRCRVLGRCVPLVALSWLAGCLLLSACCGSCRLCGWWGCGVGGGWVVAGWCGRVGCDLYSGREYLCSLCVLLGCACFLGVRWMPWHQGPMKDVVACDKPRGAGWRAVIRGCPNGGTRRGSCRVTRA